MHATNKTRKKTGTQLARRGEKLQGSAVRNDHGWLVIHVYGEPYPRGFAYGYLCAKDFAEIQQMLAFYIPETYGYSWPEMISMIHDDFYQMTKSAFPELLEEMRGIAAGCKAGGTQTTLDEILAWNFYLSISYWLGSKGEVKVGKEGGGKRPSARDHCSAFLAVGKDWTKDGGIVCAHNSFTDYIDGQYSNVILDMQPADGHRFIMQTSPCWIWSGTDFFITDCGIVGTETTIGGFQPYAKKNPIGYRIRKAMQYGNSLDEYCDILLHQNSGDYANSWLFGDVRSNEILRLELGLEYHNIERTKNGYFIGFNAPYDVRIRNFEVENSGFYDIRRHQGARRVRLTELMEQHKGKLCAKVAQRIIADHYDVYLRKPNHPCSRTVCSHYDLDAREYMSQVGRPVPFAPHGAVDGIVCDGPMIRRMAFLARFGNSCGIPFNKDAFCKQHIQFANFCAFLKDRPTQPWVLMQAGRKTNRTGRTIRRQKRGRRHSTTKRYPRR